ncbi:hypothetical protein COCON_G00138040 [Conger conger]|uniref:Secreted protein n=1 Tax=Conger conger TaxID=82655 RepID=A0A9Q1HXZ1_CONCO|nr:hypothetical protein COCON_G00138040 [Conger conger]
MCTVILCFLLRQAWKCVVKVGTSCDGKGQYVLLLTGRLALQSPVRAVTRRDGVIRLLRRDTDVEEYREGRGIRGSPKTCPTAERSRAQVSGSVWARRPLVFPPGTEGVSERASRGPMPPV